MSAAEQTDKESRVGKRPVTVPKGVTVSLGNGVATIKGPKGELKHPIHNAVDVSQSDDKIVISRRKAAGKEAGSFRD